MSMSKKVSSTAEKPVVKYRVVSPGLIAYGYSATVIPVDHPREHLNGKICHTSSVLEFDPVTGSFETLNTKYELYDEDAE